MRERALHAGVAAGAGLSALGLVGVGLADGPYLSTSRISPWIVLWAIGLFALLIALPFVLHRRSAARADDLDGRWERALIGWGVIALLGAVGFALVAIATGFAGSSAAGALAMVGLAECALVVGALLVLMLTTG